MLVGSWPFGHVLSPDELEAARRTIDGQSLALLNELSQEHLAAAEEIRALEEKIAAIRARTAQKAENLQRQVQELKTKWNGLAGVFRLLPAEIVNRILVECNPLDSHRGLTRSCKHWRLAVHDCPEMWSMVKRPEYLQMHLKKSKQAPLSIQLDLSRLDSKLSAGDGLAVCQALPSQIHRIRDLDIRLYRRQFTPFLSVLDVSSAPLLETLRISDGRNQDQLECDSEIEDSALYPWPEPPATLSPSFLKNNAPRLRQLTLVGCIPAWNLDIFSNLTTLCVDSFVEYPDMGRDSAADFLQALGRMRRLVTLHLCFPLPNMLNLPPDTPLLFLPALQRFTLLTSLVDCAGLLERLRLPASSSVSIELFPYSEDEITLDDVTSFGAALRSAWISPLGDTMDAKKPDLSLTISESYGADFILKRMTDDDHIGATTTEAATPGELRVDTSREYVSEAQVSFLASTLSLGAALHSLTFSGDLRTSSGWTEILPPLSALKHLTLSGDVGAQVVGWLDREGGASQSDPLPQLQVLSFIRQDFSDDVPDSHLYDMGISNEPDGEPDPVPLLDALHRFIHRKSKVYSQRRGTTPTHLHLVFDLCHGLTESDFQRMQDVGASVELRGAN